LSIIPSSVPSDDLNASAEVQVIVGITQENPLIADQLLEIEQDILDAAVGAITRTDSSGRRNLQSSQSIVVGGTSAELSTVATTTTCDGFNPFESIQCSLVEITIKEKSNTDFDCESGKQAITNAINDGSFISGPWYVIKLLSSVPTLSPSHPPNDERLSTAPSFVENKKSKKNKKSKNDNKKKNKATKKSKNDNKKKNKATKNSKSERKIKKN
jgi:hypothetical protein